MKTVYKYPLSLGCQTVINVLKGAHPIYAADRDGQPYLYMMVDDVNDKTEERIFLVEYDIVNATSNFEYVTSLMICFFVRHIFEVK